MEDKIWSTKFCENLKRNLQYSLDQKLVERVYVPCSLANVVGRCVGRKDGATTNGCETLRIVRSNL